MGRPTFSSSLFIVAGSSEEAKEEALRRLAMYEEVEISEPMQMSGRGWRVSYTIPKGENPWDRPGAKGEISPDADLGDFVVLLLMGTLKDARRALERDGLQEAADLLGMMIESCSMFIQRERRAME